MQAINHGAVAIHEIEKPLPFLCVPPASFCILTIALPIPPIAGESRIVPHLQLQDRRHMGYVDALPLRKEWLVVHVDVRPGERLLLRIVSDT